MFGFKYAFNGLMKLITSERNFQIQLILFLITLTASWYFNISSIEWIVILIISALVLSLEAINSSIERLCNLYTKDYNESVEWIKDVTAAAVLISAIIALIIGGIIFIPKILVLFNS